MPQRIPQYQQQTTIGVASSPRAQAPQMIDGIGAALREMGDTLGRAAKEQYTVTREADLSDRLGRATAELADLEIGFERDQEFQTAPTRFQTGADSIRDKYLDGVTDPAVKSAFTKRFGELALSKRMNVVKDAFAKEKNYYSAALDTSLEVFAQSAANARNPAERAIVENEARLAIAGALTSGRIDPVEAGKRERGFLGKIDQSTVIRDMSIDPMLVVAKLGIDPAYAPNLDPVMRERFIDQSVRRAEADRKTQEAAAARAAKARGDEVAKDLWGKLTDRSLTREYLDQNRLHLEPGEYRSMLKALNDPTERKDDPGAFATLNGLLDTNPAEARRKAFQFHRSGLIRNETLNSITTSARSIERQEGPKSPYERESAYIRNLLRPSDMVPDPAAQARFGLAMREFEDFAATTTDAAALRAKADDIIKRVSMVDMADLARRTGVGNRPTPAQTIEAIDRQIVAESESFTAGKITKAERDRRIQRLNQQRTAAERANGR